MLQLDHEINVIIMNEIGLEVDSNHRIIDQDTRSPVQMNGMDIVAPGVYGGPESVEFDPYNNRKLMTNLFSYFLKKAADEGEREVSTFYNIDGTKNSPGMVECMFTDKSTITSKPYNRDTLKYADIIMQMNGDPNPDLSKFDVARNDTIRKKPATRKKKA